MGAFGERRDLDLTKLKLIDYINIAIQKNYMLWILVTSGAEGKLPSLGFDYGAGKSTKGLGLLCSTVYAGNWEKVKANCIGAYWEIESILDRPQPTLGIYWDDMQSTVGKDKQHSPAIKELAYYITTVRPYIKVWIGSAPHRDMLQKDFRQMFHFEVICPRRGMYEVQQLKRFIDFDRPQKPRERFKYRGEGIFPSLSPEMQKWYDEWRDEKNRMIRSRLRAFRVREESDLRKDKLSEREKTLLDDIVAKGFIGYEHLHDKGLSHYVLWLRRRGWLEMDTRRRVMLSAEAEEVLFGHEYQR